MFEDEVVHTFAPYKHDVLELETNQIRLFRLLTIWPQDGVPMGTLETFPIERAPEYTAVSYEWGPGPDSCPLLVNDGFIMLRQNLMDFLRAFPRLQNILPPMDTCNGDEFERTASRTMENATERAISQGNDEGIHSRWLRSAFDEFKPGAQAMAKSAWNREKDHGNIKSWISGRLDDRQRAEYARRQIWQRANPAYLWIDQICINQTETREKSLQVQQMSRVFQQAHQVLAWLGDNASIARYFSMQAYDLSSSQAEMEAAKADFVQNSFWTRLWIQQELLLSRSLYFVSGCSIISCEHLRSRKPAYESPPRLLQILLNPGQEKPIWFPAYENKELIPLTWAIGLFSINECSEVKDRVFGILGMVIPEERVPVDYRIPVDTLFFSALEIAASSRFKRLLPAKATEYAFLKLARSMRVGFVDASSSRNSQGGRNILSEICELCRVKEATTGIYLPKSKDMGYNMGFARRTAAMLKPPNDFVVDSTSSSEQLVCVGYRLAIDRHLPGSSHDIVR